MPFKILFLTLPLLTLSCSLLSKEDCQKSRVANKAFQDGSTGASNRLRLLKKKCSKTPLLKSTYNTSYTKGLMQFCSFARGNEQASLGLEKERACSISADYTSGYLQKLESVCSSEKARIDARKLLNSDNRICLIIPKYKKAYLKRLSTHCSYNKGFNIGLQKKAIDQNCKDAKNSKNFKSGHRAGLVKRYKNDNIEFQKQIYNLKIKRKSTQKKIKLAKKPEVLQKLKIELNVAESEILDLEHRIEENKRFIN